MPNHNDHLSVAIMQPYVFPYIGYFNLIHSCNVFVFYDDVNFIKGGWINRNFIISNEKRQLFSAPLSKVSSNKLINEIDIHQFDRFRRKFLTMLKTSYGGASHYRQGLDYVYRVLDVPTDKISDLAVRSVKAACELMGLNRKFLLSSESFPDTRRPGDGRVGRLCRIVGRLQSSSYINSIGGQTIYHKEDFLAHGIELFFNKPKFLPYKQKGTSFIAGCSVIDAIFNCCKEDLAELVSSYELLA